MIDIGLDPRWRVSLEIAVDLAVPPANLWSQSWIPRFLVRVWFRWVLLHTREKLRNLLLEGELRSRESCRSRHSSPKSS